MNRMDNDLRSIQEARILTETARTAQKLLAGFSQAKLDAIVMAMVTALGPHVRELAVLSQEETGFGDWRDKWVKNVFASSFVHRYIAGLTVVGIVSEDKQQQTIDIGVPVGVIAGLVPATNPVSTTIYKTLIALKAGNAIVFSPHPRAQRSIAKVLEILNQAAMAAGMPSGAIGYMRTVTTAGAAALMNHRDTALILLTGVPKLLSAAKAAGKPLIYGGPGNGPAFIERSADINQAVTDIINSRSFDHGIVSASEQSIVVEACIADQVRHELIKHGGYFLTPPEAAALGELLFAIDGTLNPAFVGKSALNLAARLGITVPETTKVLIAEQDYVGQSNPYAREKLCPVLAFYIEQNWQYACEKCIELLVTEGLGHTLVIHSRNESVIREFALKKPVFRVLVNTPASYGGIGATTNLAPAFTLGCGAAGGTITADNISPLNLVNIRKVGYGVRSVAAIRAAVDNANVVGVKPQGIDQMDELQQLLVALLDKVH